VTRALFDLPSHVRSRLVAALEAGFVEPSAPPSVVGPTIGARSDAAAVCDALQKLEALGLNGRACAAWIRTVDDVAGRTPKPDVVWSGPQLEGVHARGTRSVYEEMWAMARHTVWVSSYAFFDGPEAFKGLAARLDALPEIACHLLLNIQRPRGDESSADDLVLRFARLFWKKEWPGRTRPRVFYDPRSLDLPYRGGVLHAKAVVVDNEVLFVTSANLTAAAFDQNVELGLLVRDHALANNVEQHFRALVEQRQVLLLPAG
jgi:phosphatidylserine/phosphatidylglycerophosphate/cardiolipin synthase-like enzyme